MIYGCHRVIFRKLCISGMMLYGASVVSYLSFMLRFNSLLWLFVHCVHFTFCDFPSVPFLVNVVKTCRTLTFNTLNLK